MGCSPQWFGLSLTGARDCDGPAIIGATWVVVTPASIDEPKWKKFLLPVLIHYWEKVLKVKP